MPRIGTTGTSGVRNGPRQVGVRAPHDDDRGAHDHERHQRADVHQVGEELQREERRRRAPTRMPVRMVALCGVRKRGWTAPKKLARDEAVARHREQDARLAQQQHEQHARDADDRADRDQEHVPTASPRAANASATGASMSISSYGTMPVSTRGDQDVEHRAERERDDDADRHVALRVAAPPRRASRPSRSRCRRRRCRPRP